MLEVSGKSQREGQVKLLLIAAFVVIFDQVTKGAVVRSFLLGETVTLIPGFFNFTYIQNPGIAFGMLPAKSGWLHWVLLSTPLLVCVFLYSWYRRMEAHQKLERFAVSLLIGGSLGNVIDRFRLGYVVDFLDFHWQGKSHYPAFNIADIAVCTGVGLLFLSSFRKQENEGLKNV